MGDTAGEENRERAAADQHTAPEHGSCVAYDINWLTYVYHCYKLLAMAEIPSFAQRHPPAPRRPSCFAKSLSGRPRLGSFNSFNSFNSPGCALPVVAFPSLDPEPIISRPGTTRQPILNRYQWRLFSAITAYYRLLSPNREFFRNPPISRRASCITFHPSPTEFICRPRPSFTTVCRTVGRQRAFGLRIAHYE